MAYKVSADGRSRIRIEEGEKLVAYYDTAKPPVLTIGVGHTSAAGAPAVTKGMKITKAQSDEILARDLGDVEATINSLVKVPLTQQMVDALGSLIFNIGSSKFSGSTLLKRLNASDYAAAANQFLVWKNAGGKPQLLDRRKRERVLFLSGGVPSAKAPAPTSAAAPAIINSTTIEVVQKKLIGLGYTEVGNPDGRMGKLTETAILAFRKENGLPLSSVIDNDLLTALDTAKPRTLARNDATPTDVRAAVPEVKANFLAKVTGAVGAGGVGVSALGDMGSKVDAIRGYITPWKEMFADIPSWIWLAGVAGIFAAIFFVARHGEKKGVDAYQDGSRR